MGEGPELCGHHRSYCPALGLAHSGCSGILFFDTRRKEIFSALNVPILSQPGPWVKEVKDQ